ncbi:MAG: cytochrome c-type biogenesis protein CcmH [Proteobacteria bacterium]|jgi:cytochrome c-type biogenesis protein CcmH|nr:cytochrome c-type biogenesis protein CcmH [Pseudomonadota bacterium]
MRRAVKIILIGFSVTLLIIAQNSHAAEIEIREFPNNRVSADYQQLINELRCLVCQNQNLAASDADLASDLRDETYNMLISGKTVAEVKEFMVARYGEFVLYKPPFSPATWIIWIGPFVLLAFGLFIAVRITRNSANTSIPAPSAADEKRVNKLLDN